MEYEYAKSRRRKNLHNKRQARHRNQKLHPNNNNSKPHNHNRQIYENTKKWFSGFSPPHSILYDINHIEVEDIDNNGVSETIVDVCNQDTLDMAMDYCEAGFKPLVLNMASDYKPGGGVASGKTAQEECLFRRTNAFMTHPKKWYPLQSNQIIYSPEVEVIKDNNYQMLPTIFQCTVGMIAVAAIRKPNLVNGEYKPQDRKLMSDKIESVFKIAINHGHDTLVLGALGCGVFRNPSNEVAGIFRTMIRIYGGHFKSIGFAVLVVKPRDEQNFHAFSRLITKEKEEKKKQKEFDLEKDFPAL